MQVATIGFTNKSAQQFFELLKRAEVRTVLDVRLNNVSQLAGFAKKNDLRYFLSNLLDCGYLELRDLAPEKTMLKRYQAKEIAWKEYADSYLELLARRRVENNLDTGIFDHSCLLCSEDTPHFCHRRLAVEYLNSTWGNSLKITHLY
ncbi:hypothetical protein LMG19089_01458 [Ralstonia edaphis]|uniref:DUF488 domain-containing protein n=1 Tax=Ralstonia edaphi TaxID=3058599 RepID=UPI0028F665F8|nr:DUF488 domain-containing protein [Ralstonia sp. LMG 6871]CAJ0695126.1 hypothetical protein LMG19089_01458 [Ralstonia sp. LMG 6871]